MCLKVLFPLINTCNEYLLVLLYCGGGRNAFLCLLTEQSVLRKDCKLSWPFLLSVWVYQ